MASAAGCCCLDDPDQLRACSTNTKQKIQQQEERNPPNFCGEVGRNGRVKGGCVVPVEVRWRGPAKVGKWMNLVGGVGVELNVSLA